MVTMKFLRSMSLLFLLLLSTSLLLSVSVRCGDEEMIDDDDEEMIVEDVLGESDAEAFFGQDEEPETSVVSLGPDTFQEAIDSHDLIVVEFFAPWCKHCVKMAPEYEKVAKHFKGKVTIAKVDYTEEGNDDITVDAGVTGLPTIFIYKNGVQSVYTGEKKAKAIIDYVEKKQLSDMYVVLRSATDVKLFVDDNDRVLIGRFDAEEGEAFETFRRAAGGTVADDSEVAVGVVLDGEVASAADMDVEDKHIAVYLDGEKAATVRAVDVDGALASQITAPFFPLVESIDRSVFTRLENYGLPIAVIGYHAEWDDDDDDKEALEMATQIATAWEHKIKVTIADHAKEGEQLKRLGTSGNVYPTALIMAGTAKHGALKDDEAIYNFNESDEFTIDSVIEWGLKVIGGTASHWQKSAPIHDNDADDAEVLVVVADSYDEIVRDTSKDVVLMITVDNDELCEQCEAMEEEYEATAVALKDAGVSTLVLAKYDIEYNGVNEELRDLLFQVPTYFVFPASNKTITEKNLYLATEFDPSGLIDFVSSLPGTIKFDGSGFVALERSPPLTPEGELLQRMADIEEAEGSADGGDGGSDGDLGAKESCGADGGEGGEDIMADEL